MILDMGMQYMFDASTIKASLVGKYHVNRYLFPFNLFDSVLIFLGISLLLLWKRKRDKSFELQVSWHTYII